MAVALRHHHRGATEGDARAGVGRRPSARGVWFGMADEESFFVSADEAEDDGRGRATGPGSSRGPASSKAPLDHSKQRPLGPLDDSDDEPPGALDRTANETVEDSDAFVSGDDARVQVSARGGIAGHQGTGANGEASGTDGEFVSGADTDTGIDGLPRAPRRLRTPNAVQQVLLQEEDAMATPLSPGTMLNEAWELAMGSGGDATRDSHHEHRILDEDDEPTPLTLFRDAIDEDNDEEEEDPGFASAGNDGANERVGPGQADDVALDVMPNDDSLVNDDSFADPALDISVEDTGHDADGAGTPQRSARAPASSHVAMCALSPPSPLVAPSERHSFRLSRQASLQSHGSGSSQKSSSTPSRGWGEGGHATPDTTRRLSKAEEVLKAATRHSSDDDVDELADSSDEERAGPSMASSSILGGTPQTLQSQRASIGSHGSFSPYGSEGDVPSPHGGLLDSASRRQERRRLQKERYLQKLTKGFNQSGSDPETLKKRAEALRRNASSEPDRPLRHSWSVDTSGLADRGGDKWLVGDSPGGGRRQVRGFETTGERRGSSRLTARHSLQRESELTRASDPRRTKSGGLTGEALGSPVGAAHGSPMGAMGSPGMTMGSPGMTMGSPGMMPMPGFGGMMAGMMAPQMQHMQMQQMMMMQAQMQTQMRMYQTQMQAQMAGMSIQSPGQLEPIAQTSSLAAAAADQGVAEDRLRRVFHLVADNADDEVMDLIDTRAVDVDLVDQSGNTLLMASCAAGHKRLSRHLVKRFAGLNLQNLEGNTALHFALAMGHSELGDFLVAKGADDGVTNNYGLSPFEGLAPQNGGGGGQQIGQQRQNRY